MASWLSTTLRERHDAEARPASVCVHAYDGRRWPHRRDDILRRSVTMHTTMMAGILSRLLAVAAVPVGAQVAGSTTSGVSPDEVKTLARGWSAKTQILGKPVYNDQDEQVGEVEDRIVTP